MHATPFSELPGLGLTCNHDFTVIAPAGDLKIGALDGRDRPESRYRSVQVPRRSSRSETYV